MGVQRVLQLPPADGVSLRVILGVQKVLQLPPAGLRPKEMLPQDILDEPKLTHFSFPTSTGHC